MVLGEIFGKVTEFYQKRYSEMAGYQKPEMIPEGDEIVAYLATIPDYVYARYGFNREPLKGKLTDGERDECIRASMEEGLKFAAGLKENYPGLKPAEIAEKLGVSVSRPQVPSGGGHVRFAEFEQPDKIRIFLDAFDKTEDMIKEYEMEDFFRDISLEDVLIAHELFHLIEMKNEDTIYTQTKRIKLWKLGPIEYSSKLVSLPEIAAMSFAKELAELPFSAYFFDVFLTYSYNKELGTLIFNEIKALNESYA